MAPRRVRAVGGVAAWRLPVLFGAVVAVALGMGEPIVALVLATVGCIAMSVERARVLEISDRGLARGVVIGSGLVGPARVVRWSDVRAIDTRWCQGGCVLEAAVHAADGSVLTFDSRMGLAAFHALLTETSRRAPAAQEVGLTGQALREEPQPRFRLGRLWAALVPAALVALLIALAAGF